MAKTSLFAGRIATLLLACCVFAPPTYAGLSRAPSSHTEPTADGRHVLVFLAPVEPIEEGNVTEEEHNRTVFLNNMYRASGCYEIGSTTPLWTAPWDDTDGWTVSDDCRYLVRWNVFGDGSSRDGGRNLSWGIKLYDHGAEIRNYDVAELVDYPALMPFTSSDWHYMWIGDSDDNCTIQDGQFIFQTSTHERYRFDLATGAIIEQFRMWRTLTRAGTALLTMAVVGIAVLLVRRRTRAAAAQQTAECLPETSQQSSARRSTRFFNYSLRTLLLVTTAIALLCLMVPRWPHIAILLIAILNVVLLTRAALQYRRATRFARGSGRRRAGFALRAVAAGLAWCCCYVLSVAPVLRLVDWLRAPDDVRMAIILTAYRPLVWIELYCSHGVFSPLEWYFRAWGIR